MQGNSNINLFTGIATVNKEMYIDILSRLRLAVRRKRPDNQQSVSPSRQCSSTPVGLGQEFLKKEKCYNTGASPIHS